jgi:HD superfamily phosphohydrolase YqeK
LTLPAWAVVTPARREHIARVADLISRWAAAMGVSNGERERWLRAAWLHDALRDAPVAELERWAPTSPGPASLRHGPASAARAESEGETDLGVLDAVRYHSLGHAGWDMVGRSLYCADYLEPGREFARERRAELARRYPADPHGVLRDVAAERVAHIVASRWPIPDPTVRFWNSLAGSSSNGS